VKKDKVETIPLMVRMENRREEYWIPKKFYSWGGGFETAVVG